MPLDVGPPNCGFGDLAATIDFANQAVANGLALMGPVIDPPYSQSETRDGCHPNDAGAARATEIVLEWLESIDPSR